MERNSDTCFRCGASINFVERINLESAVEIPGKGALCPNCYRKLSPEEHISYFKY